MTNANRMFPAALAAVIALGPTLAFAQARDGSAANPPSDAVGRTIDRVTGQPSQILGAIHPPHTATAAASHRLDEHREAQLGGVTRQLGEIGGWRGGLQRGQSSRPGVLDGPHLVAGQPDRAGTGPDEDQPCVRAGSRENRDSR